MKREGFVIKSKDKRQSEENAKRELQDLLIKYGYENISAENMIASLNDATINTPRNKAIAKFLSTIPVILGFETIAASINKMQSTVLNKTEYTNILSELIKDGKEDVNREERFKEIFALYRNAIGLGKNNKKLISPNRNTIRN